MDKREDLLVRILALLATVPGVARTYRDRGDIPPVDTESNENLLPALLLLDGREETRVQVTSHNIPRPMTPAVVALIPQIWIILKPSERLDNAGQGELLSSFRVAVLKVLRDDEVLQQIMGSGGGIEYHGLETDMQTGSTMEGQMMLSLAFLYTLNPSDL